MFVFGDSFDYYDDLSLKWDSGNGAAIDLTGTKSRTGIGAMTTSGVQFPTKSIPAATAYVCGCGFMVEDLANQGTPIAFKHNADLQVQFRVNASGGIDVVDQIATRASTVGGLVSANVYAYIEVESGRDGAYKRVGDGAHERYPGAHGCTCDLQRRAGNQRV